MVTLMVAALYGVGLRRAIDIVAPGKTAAFARDLREFVKGRLSKHEYPRPIEIVDELPKTPAGKIGRKTLRERAT